MRSTTGAIPPKRTRSYAIYCTGSDRFLILQKPKERIFNLPMILILIVGGSEELSSGPRWRLLRKPRLDLSVVITDRLGNEGISAPNKPFPRPNAVGFYSELTGHKCIEKTFGGGMDTANAGNQKLYPKPIKNQCSNLTSYPQCQYKYPWPGTYCAWNLLLTADLVG